MRTTPLSVFFFAAATTLLAHAGDAAADTRPPPSEAAVKDASQHFDRGVKLFEDADFPLALVEFKRSYEAVSDYRTLFNIGQVQYQLGDFAEARRTLTRYLTEGGARIPAARRTEVERDLDSLKIRTALLRIDVDAADAAIAIDGQRVGTSPLPDQLLVNGGPHTIVVTKAGYSPMSYDVSLAGTEGRVIAIHLVPAPAQEVHVTSSGLGPVWIGWGLTAALAAGTAGMGASLGSASSALADAKSRMTSKAELEEKASAVDTRQTITFVLGGATIVAAGVALYFTLARKNAAFSGPTTGARSAPHFAVGPSGVGATF